MARGRPGGGRGHGSGRTGTTAGSDLGAWITGDGLDAAAVGGLAADGFDQVVLRRIAADLHSGQRLDHRAVHPERRPGHPGVGHGVRRRPDAPGSTPIPGDPVLAAHQLVAELAQLYYERPNGITPRAVLAVAPTSWDDDPAFVDALLGLARRQPARAGRDHLPALRPLPDAGHLPVRVPAHLDRRAATPPGDGHPGPAARGSTGSPTSAVGARALGPQLGDLVLAGEAQTLRPGPAVGGPGQRRCRRRTPRSARSPSRGPDRHAHRQQRLVPGHHRLRRRRTRSRPPWTLSSDKLLFPNGETQWSTTVTLLPRHSNVVYVRVQDPDVGRVPRSTSRCTAPDGRSASPPANCRSGRRRRRWSGWSSPSERWSSWPSGGSARRAGAAAQRRADEAGTGHGAATRSRPSRSGGVGQARRRAPAAP